MKTKLQKIDGYLLGEKHVPFPQFKFDEWEFQWNGLETLKNKWINESFPRTARWATSTRTRWRTWRRTSRGRWAARPSKEPSAGDKTRWANCRANMTGPHASSVKAKLRKLSRQQNSNTGYQRGTHRRWTNQSISPWPWPNPVKKNWCRFLCHSGIDQSDKSRDHLKPLWLVKHSRWEPKATQEFFYRIQNQ